MGDVGVSMWVSAAVFCLSVNLASSDTNQYDVADVRFRIRNNYVPLRHRASAIQDAIRVGGREACASLCAQSEDCQVFTYRAVTDNCRLWHPSPALTPEPAVRLHADPDTAQGLLTGIRVPDTGEQPLHYYHMAGNLATHSDAHVACTTSFPGSHVLTFETEAELDILQHADMGTVWTSGILVGSDWMWDTGHGLHNLSYTAWLDGAPSGEGDCLMADVTQFNLHPLMALKDSDCSRVTLVVCEATFPL